MALRKSQIILDRMEKSGQLSPDGKNWLIQAIDPFHDLPIRSTGLPDPNSAASVVQCVKLQTTVSKPAGLAAGNWDCHISSTPWWTQLSNFSYTSIGRNGINMGSSSTIPATNPAGGLTIVSVPTGMTTGFSGNNNGVSQVLSLATTYFDGPSRVVSAGFEVYNTTAEIYKQGGVTCYRMDQPTDAEYAAPVYINGGLATAALQSVVTVRARKDRPQTIAAAQLLEGSRSWKAEEGCYCVLGMNNVYSDQTLAAPVVYSLISDDYNSGIAFGLTNPGTAPNLPSVQSVYQNKSYYDTTGAYFTGLSDQTTLNVFFNVFVERFPLPTQNADLVTLADPSPPYDPVALELYSRIMIEMPVGVPVRENGLGQWFIDAVSNVAPMVSDALSVIPHPYAQIASQGVKAAGKFASKRATKGAAGPGMGDDELRAKTKAKKKKKKAKAQAAIAAARQ